MKYPLGVWQSQHKMAGCHSAVLYQGSPPAILLRFRLPEYAEQTLLQPDTANVRAAASDATQAAVPLEEDERGGGATDRKAQRGEGERREVGRQGTPNKL